MLTGTLPFHSANKRETMSLIIKYYIFFNNLFLVLN